MAGSFTSGRERASATVGEPDRARAWLAHHRRVGIESLAGLLAAGVSSLLTWLVIGIAMVLPALGYVLLANATTLTGGWDGRPQITVYLKMDVTADRSEGFTRTLERWPTVSEVRLISKDAALLEFQARSGFGDVVGSLERNPLPAVVLVTPAVESSDELVKLSEALEATGETDDVVIDLEWIERLSALLELGQRAVLALGFFLSLGVLLIVGNTIRLAIENRRSEIEVIKLVGATDGFVRRPFLYLGFWYGGIGALLALMLLYLCLWFLNGPVQRLLGSYGSDFEVVGLGGAGAIAMLACGGVLGVAGAWLAVSRHLGQIQPH